MIFMKQDFLHALVAVCDLQYGPHWLAVWWRASGPPASSSWPSSPGSSSTGTTSSWPQSGHSLPHLDHPRELSLAPLQGEVKRAEFLVTSMVAYNSIKLDNHTLVPFLIFGGQCLVSAMLTYLLPETFNVDLPYIIDEASEG